ncbi:LysR family transcriptional regulator [Vibrio sp. F13]|nr:LysR family transcriptional regulator [Vibrio sp. F13]
MDLKTLTTFVTVARLKNFTAAARELHTVQPTVSRHISDLENELQTKLFDRTTHQVDLTPSGERLLPEALHIIENDQRVKSVIKQIDSDEHQEIKVGYLATACSFFLPELINRFRARYTNAQLRLYEMTPAEQIEAMVDNKVDIVFSR